jgi:hypothetical protein
MVYLLLSATSDKDHLLHYTTAWNMNFAFSLLSIDQSNLFPISRLDIFDSIVVSISACHLQGSSQEAGVRFPVGEIRFVFVA